MSGELRVVIADDELLARRRLLRLVGALPGVEVVGECETADEVLRRVQQRDVDVLLLDIHMPGLSGIEAMALLPDDAPYVIFCTAHPDHAVEAFEHGAVDYVLKPVEAARLAKALARARERVRPRTTTSGGERALSKLAVPTRKGIVLVDTDAVSHAVVEDTLVIVHTEQERFLTDFTLQELEDKLPADRFERVHRKALLNLDKVACLEPLETGGYVARTRSGETVTISRQAARRLRRRLGL